VSHQQSDSVSSSHLVAPTLLIRYGKIRTLRCGRPQRPPLPSSALVSQLCARCGKQVDKRLMSTRRNANPSQTIHNREAVAAAYSFPIPRNVRPAQLRNSILASWRHGNKRMQKQAIEVYQLRLPTLISDHLATPPTQNKASCPPSTKSPSPYALFPSPNPNQDLPPMPQAQVGIWSPPPRTPNQSHTTAAI
jgi:hypothetical protein